MRKSWFLLSRTLRGPPVGKGSEGDEMVQVGRQGSSEEMYPLSYHSGPAKRYPPASNCSRLVYRRGCGSVLHTGQQ